MRSDWLSGWLSIHAFVSLSTLHITGMVLLFCIQTDFKLIAGIASIYVFFAIGAEGITMSDRNEKKNAAHASLCHRQ